MNLKKWLIPVILFIGIIGLLIFRKIDFNRTEYYIGQPIDSLNGVIVYYNGSVSNVSGRNMTSDNYNLGQKYQCVEFVKRYYYEFLDHKMPETYGHAKDFFDKTIKDGKRNEMRDLIQYENPGKTKPMVNDLLVFSGTPYNRYGHVAIVSKVSKDKIEIIQQNPGPHGKSRVKYSISYKNNTWMIKNRHILGWLRKE